MEGAKSGSSEPLAPASPRLVFRPWRDSDLSPFAALNADAEVARWLSGPLSREQSDALVGRIREGFAQHGFGFWAIATQQTSEFLGFVGLSRPGFQASFTPCVEVGWRLARKHWGHGYASEGGRASLAFGFEVLGLEEIVSFTAETNRRSRAVMERIGMKEEEEFDHPALSSAHPLRRHVLYRLRRRDWPDRRS